MSPRLTRRSSSPSRVHHCTLSLLTAAILMAGVQAAPVLAATPAQQPSRNMGDYRFAIAQQPLVSALNAFTAVTGWQVGLPAELGEGVASPGVHGALSPEKALDRLLVGTNLSYRKLGANNIVLEKRAAGGTLALQQMTISATRQEQSIDSVPATVSVQTREELDRNNVNTIKELVRYEPGVAVGGTGTRGGISGYNIRGIDGDRVLTQVERGFRFLQPMAFAEDDMHRVALRPQNGADGIRIDIVMFRDDHELRPARRIAFPLRRARRRAQCA